jgi:hypothetical protein
VQVAIPIIGRLLQHFPGRQTDRDAVIMSDVAADCVAEGVSENALRQACSDIRRNASKDNPFPPVSGEILRQAKARTEAEQRPHEAGSSRIIPGTFTQIIRKYEPGYKGEILEERKHGKHLNPTEIWALYPGVRTHVSYRQD